MNNKDKIIEQRLKTAILLEDMISDAVSEILKKYFAQIEEMLVEAVSEILEKKYAELLAKIETKIGPKGDKGDKPVAGIDFPIPQNGKDADETKIVMDVLSRIPPPIKGDKGDDGKVYKAEEIRDMLQSLKDNERLDVSAIKGIKELVDRFTPQLGGGGMGQGDIYVETPVGEINSVNKTYTVSHDITLVVGFAIGGETIHPDEYTTSGKIITFVTALHGDLSGKAFTIVFV